MDKAATKHEIGALLVTGITTNQKFTAKQIARHVGINETDDTCPVTRGLIRDMIKDGGLIGSNSAGYFVMTTGKEVQSYFNGLLQRQMAISKRIADIYQAAKSRGLV